MPYAVCTDCGKGCSYRAKRGDRLEDQRSACCEAPMRAFTTGRKAVQCYACKLLGIRTDLRELVRPPCLFVILKRKPTGGSYEVIAEVESGPHEPAWLCSAHGLRAWPADFEPMEPEELVNHPLLWQKMKQWRADIRISRRTFTEEDLDLHPELKPIQACRKCKGARSIYVGASFQNPSGRAPCPECKGGAK